ncbi:MAG: integrase family protein [Nitrospina sp.]|jgi:integrase|nr:integrase family protein [Nitrospina sp.]
MADKVRLNRTTIKGIPFFKPIEGSKGNQRIYRDSELPGFCLRVTSNAKYYIINKRIHGRLIREVVGKYPTITPEDARDLAREILLKIHQGVDLAAEKKIELITLEKAFDDFIETRNLAERTKKDYNLAMNLHLADWKRKKVTDITRDMVARRHKKIGLRSKTAANQAMRFLRSLMNFAAGQYDDGHGDSILKANPVERLSQVKQWYPEQRRRTIIKEHELPSWFKAVQEIKSETVKDYILLLFLTGLRRQEGFKLKWADVDLKGRTFTISETKNKNPLALPLGEFTYDIFKRRKEGNNENQYVFPGSGKTGHLVEPKKQVAEVFKNSGVKFCLHDLRRGFITIAESLDISSYAVKALVNHSLNGDVTGGYIVISPERLRGPMQRIETHLLKLCTAKDPENPELNIVA